MKIPLLYAVLLLGLLLAAGIFRRPWLFAAWVISFLVFPTVHLRLAGAPVYFYDLITVLCLGSLILSGEAQRWPRSIPRWHWWFIGSAFVLSVGCGVLKFGWAPDMVWIWGHSSLAWMAFALGIVLSTSAGRTAYRTALAAGTLISGAILAAIALVQFADLSWSEQISGWFYDDLGSTQSVELLRVGKDTNRATGPHFAPTGFAGISLLMVLVYWLCTDERQRWLRWTALGLTAAIIVCTVSRHVVVAAGLALVIVIALSEARKSVKLLGFGALALLVISTSAVGLMTKQSWAFRLAKWEGGVLQDDNIAARVLWGPERLAEFIGDNPSVLITGAGLDVEKLASRTDRLGSFEGGFVSNGFLLALYYLGIGGFLLYSLFWFWAFRVAWHAPRGSRATLVASVATAVIIVASDNYSFVHEPAVALLFLLVGLLAGNRHHELEHEIVVDDEPVAAPPEWAQRPLASG